MLHHLFPQAHGGFCDQVGGTDIYTKFNSASRRFFTSFCNTDPDDWGWAGNPQHRISPILLSCYNRSEFTAYSVSHNAAGLNAFYLDGHARWIRRQEVTAPAPFLTPSADPYVQWLDTYYPNNATFPNWARWYATLNN